MRQLLLGALLLLKADSMLQTTVPVQVLVDEETAKYYCNETRVCPELEQHMGELLHKSTAPWQQLSGRNEVFRLESIAMHHSPNGKEDGRYFLASASYHHPTKGITAYVMSQSFTTFSQPLTDEGVVVGLAHIGYNSMLIYSDQNMDREIRTFLHEYGHLIGVEHSKVRNTLMHGNVGGLVVDYPTHKKLKSGTLSAKTPDHSELREMEMRYPYAKRELQAVSFHCPTPDNPEYISSIVRLLDRTRNEDRDAIRRFIATR